MSMALLDVCCPTFVADVSIFMIVLTMFGVIIFESNDENTSVQDRRYSQRRSASEMHFVENASCCSEVEKSQEMKRGAA